MKQFIQKIILFFSPVVILLCLFEVFLRIIPNDYKYKKEQLLKDAQNIEVLVLGSSHAHYGINPDYLSFRGFNLSNISQSLDLDYKLLETYGKDMKHLKVVVLPISYSSLFSSLEAGNESWRIKNYVLYYHLITSYSIKDNCELLNGTLTSNLYRLYHYITDRDKLITVSDKGFGLNYSSDVKNNMEETGKSAALRHTHYDIKLFNFNSEIIQNIIKWCNERDIKLLFITLPAYYTYKNRLNNDQLEDTVDYMVHIERENENVYYYNFLDDNDFVEDDFFDADHLNELGAMKFTKKVDSAIKNEITFK